MTVGIIGAGAIGLSIAKHLAAAGIDTRISNSHAPTTLTQVARELGPTVLAASRHDAARAHIVVVAVRWQHLRAALSELPRWEGRIVVDAMNPIVPPGVTVAPLAELTSSEIVAGLTPGARVVKAFNTLPPQLLASDPRQAGGRRVITLAGRRGGKGRGQSAHRATRIRAHRSGEPHGWRQAAAVPGRRLRGPRCRSAGLAKDNEALTQKPLSMPAWVRRRELAGPTRSPVKAAGATSHGDVDSQGRSLAWRREPGGER